jgi:CheY-like chemotaxis protein
MVATPSPHKYILLVDDQFTTRECMSMILGGAGYRVSTAANGKEAMQRLRGSERPDVILLDLRMPVMDGWELREELKRDKELASIPVVVITGLDVTSVQGPCLHKPIETTELIEAIRRCVAERPAGGVPPPSQ